MSSIVKNMQGDMHIDNKNSLENTEEIVSNGNEARFNGIDEENTTDSDEYLSGPLRYRTNNFDESTRSDISNITLQAENLSFSEENGNQFSRQFSNFSDISGSIQIPIVGYEIMEERARFTVYKLRIEHKSTGDCWYVFRRYTDFVRLCNRLRTTSPDIIKHLPRKRWLKNNFDPLFLEERLNGLQSLINAILGVPELLESKEIQDFFCLVEPPNHTENGEESRAIFEALEETISDLKLQVREREAMIDSLQERLHITLNENEHFKQIIRSSSQSCDKCQKSEQKSDNNTTTSKDK